MKTLIVCATFDFQNFTRRITVEAIARLVPGTVALCYANLIKYGKLRTQSKHMKVRTLYYILPTKLRDTFFGRVERRILGTYWKKFFLNFDFIMLTSPDQSFLTHFITDQKLVFLISDPYHMYGEIPDEIILEKIKLICDRASIILATSSQLKHRYLNKYVSVQASGKAHYWPNSVDVEIWNYENLSQYYSRNDPPIIGFAGNFMNVTDINLLNYVTDQCMQFRFEIAGKINLDENSRDYRLLKKIFSKTNVNYLGFVNQDELPKIVIKWDVCIMIDRIDERASYHHHNKLYQYLALGKPVVAQRNHGDYDKFMDVVLLSETTEDFSQNLNEAIKKTGDFSYKERCVEIAKQNSSIIRAQQFLEIVKNEC